MASTTTTTPTVKKVSAETQTINSFEALLKTDNIFLFIPNIIGKKKRYLFRIFIKKKILFRIYESFSLDCFVLFYANASKNNDYLLFNKPIS